MKSSEERTFSRDRVAPSLPQVMRWHSRRKQTKCAAAFMALTNARRKNG